MSNELTTSIPSNFSHKTVSFRFDGIELKISLSHALFSSFSIDSGSQLLLKTIREKIDFSSCKTILDTGCGTGILGIAVAAKHPHLQLFFEDRDCLATVFATANAMANGITPVASKCSLSFDSVPYKSMDLILFNVPAKAGDPVLKSMVQSSIRTLSLTGIAAIVIVNTLAERWKEYLEQENVQILHNEAAREHTVFLYKGTELSSSTAQSFPGPYLRQTAVFENLKLSTVFNIPGFESPCFTDRLHFSILEKIPAASSVLVFTPAQGWLPCAILSRFHDTTLSLASRDALSLKISAFNAHKLTDKIFTSSISDNAFYACNQKHDTVFLTLDPIPETDLNSLTWKTLGDIIRSEGHLSLCGTSNDYNHFMKKKSGFSIIREFHKKGLRACLLKKQ